MPGISLRSSSNGRHVTVTPKPVRQTSASPTSSPSPDPFMPSRTASARRRLRHAGAVASRSHETPGNGAGALFQDMRASRQKRPFQNGAVNGSAWPVGVQDEASQDRSYHRRDGSDGAHEAAGNGISNLGGPVNDGVGRYSLRSARSKVQAREEPIVYPHISSPSPARSTASRSRSRSASLTPKPVRMPATAAKASETPLEYLLDADIVDSVAGMPSESENGEGHNAGEYDDEGYESPSKQPGDYSDDSTVSWMIERQLKGTIDASLEIPPEQLRIGAESIVDARMPQISKASGAAASGKAADDDNRASTAKSRENTNADWREAEQLSDTGNGRSSAGIDVSRVQPHPLLRGSWLTIALTITALLVPTLLLQDSIRTMPKRISPWWPLHLSPFSTDPATSLTNVTADYADTFHRFSSQVDRQISHLTRDINVLRSEWSQKLPVLKELSDAFHRVPNAPADPLATPRVNFLSPSLGTRVDRDMTSPTWAGRTGGGGGLLSRLRRAVASSERASPNGPETVLEAWHDAGDCWCSPMSQGGTQIAFKLGKPIVPEEIIVEHVPQSATLDAAATPQDMELWVQFAYMQAPSDSEHSLYDQVETVLAFDPRMVEDDETWQDPSEPTPPSASSLASSIYDALSAANSVEEPTAFTQDTLLGPTFFRIAKWRYEVGDSGTGIHHIQRFGLDANVDLPRVRAVQAVVKVASTWADEEHKGVGDHVCLYRIRLHGHT